MLVTGGRLGFTGFLLPIFSKQLKDTEAKFYDQTLKLLYLPNGKNQISFTGFYSEDFYELELITKIENIVSTTNQYDFQTLNGTLNWMHTFNDQSNLRTVLVKSNYRPKIIFPESGSSNEIEFESKIQVDNLFSEYSKEINDEVDYYLGLQVSQYKIDPGNLDPGKANSVLPVTLPKETSYELSVFSNVNWKPTEALSLTVGMRYNHFLLKGPFILNRYSEEGNDITDTQIFKKGETVTQFDDFEPRLGLRFKLDERTSVKASYARVNQYLQNIYNSTTPLPTSRWKTSDPNIRPQRSNSYGVGVYRNLKDDKIEMSLEGYYRDTKNNLTYKPGADFFLEESVERAIVQGKGRAFGVEFGFKKPKGKVNGWFNYTWSRSILRTQTQKLLDRINNNNWYLSDFDRPNVFNGTINFEGEEYNTFSFNFTAQTGRPFSVPNGVIEFEGLDVPIFLERNNGRLPTYHRLDFSWNVKYSKKKNKRWVGDWTFTIYNVYGRKNPFSIYYSQRNGLENSEICLSSPLGSFELSVIDSPVFAMTYNYTFQ